MRYIPILTLGFAMLHAIQSIVPSTLSTGTAVVPNDKEYYKYKESNVEIIYTKENLPFAKHSAGIEDSLHKDYEEFYSWELDETLYVGLISSHNQIANGFSSQYPNNRQINYLGGTQMVDYFSVTSWLDTLLYHETAHNYQVNMKANSISQDLHSVLGNGVFITPMIPMIIPNVTENSFMLEGNAVLNESWHGNGGRLYSGRFKAETILQAKAGNIVAGDVYNSKIEFPYGNIVYIQGGFYNLYLAQRYGIKNVNNYFKYHSQDFVWSQFTNESMKKAVGIDFEDSLKDFASSYAAMPIVEAQGERIASSQFFYSLNSNQYEIFFITNEDGVREPELLVIDKNTQAVKRAKDSWLAGKVLKVDDEYYTQGSKHTSPTKIHQGLFCNEGFIKKDTDSKMIQGYLSSGKEVYFDVPSSFSEPQLYVGDEFYAKVNSSVLVDKNDNIYYFIQDKKTRTLYKNKKPLYSYQGFYGIVSDVDSNGGIYFIANSENGSTLYKYEDDEVSRVSEADNIVEAKMINNNEVLLACVGDKDYYYVKNKLLNVDETPYETKLFFEEKEYYARSYKADTDSQKQDAVNLDDSYNSLLDMHYSGSDFIAGMSVDDDFIGSLSINFADPLSQNSANIFVSRDESLVSIAGASYSNSQYLLNYSISGYGVIDNSSGRDVRDYGVSAEIGLPFLQTGYYKGEIKASYFQDYETREREPLTLSVNLSRGEVYGKSMYMNYLNAIEVYGVQERDDAMFGGNYMFKHDLPKEFYISLGAKYSQTASEMSFSQAQRQTRGVKVTNIFDSNSWSDPSSIHMPNIKTSGYFKSAGYGEVGIAKVLNFSKYYFTFPLSLQRESIYAKYRFYGIESFSGYKYEINEARVGLTLSSVFLNSFSMPFSFEYIYNDGSSNLINEESQIRFLLGASF